MGGVLDTVSIKEVFEHCADQPSTLSYRHGLRGLIELQHLPVLP